MRSKELNSRIVDICYMPGNAGQELTLRRDSTTDAVNNLLETCTEQMDTARAGHTFPFTTGLVDGKLVAAVLSHLASDGL